MKAAYLLLAGLLTTTCGLAAEHVHGEMVSISFPDGDSIAIKARASPRWRTANKDATTLEEIYPKLRAEAEKGDASAAWVLSSTLTGCTFAFEDEGALEAAIARMYQSGELVSPGSENSPTPVRPGTDLAQAEEDLFRRPFRFCRGITAAQRAEATAWLQKSAELGYPPAAITYAQRRGRSNEALRMFEVSWRDGKYDAAGQLGRLYELGNPGERQPDPVKGLAFTYIYASITQRRLSGATTPIRANALQQARQHLEQKMNSIAPEQRDAAMRLAKELLAANPNCCYGF